ncbi:MAG TPA: DUF1015 domain-containing protein [Actinomycetes bacterium]|nr:DUF1015 domain-containing protein [Actinomycetes bacterium]
MPATDRATSDTPGPATADRSAADAVFGPGLVVKPFRGLRYDPAQVSDLAAVTCPPYDVIDPDSASHLEDLDPHNVVRLILPREHADERGSRYAQARDVLDRWMAAGVLQRDPEPALYVYEQSGDGLLQRGLLGAVALRDPAERVVLPHEDVMPGPVADRLELMRATSANLEPILLVYDGGGDTAAVIDEVCAGPPLLETCTEDGLVQRLWVLTDPALQNRVARDLAPRQTLIADGHHRYATYRQLQAEHRAAGDGTGDWDLGLALLVDSRSYPLHVRAIHRVVGDLPLEEALQLVEPVFRVRRLPVTGPGAGHGPDLAAALDALENDDGRHPFVVTDGHVFALIDEPATAAVEAALPPAEHSPAWRSLDASVLHAVVLDQLWGADSNGRRTDYLHDAGAAVRAAQRNGGVAVLMRAVTVDVVHALAARGERMPRKSTSFGPKPRTGLVLRLLDR